MTAEDGLRIVAELAGAERWLAVLVTTKPNGEPGVSLVNAGILAHPVTGETVIAFVSRGKTAKLANLRENPKATLVFRSGWEWISVTGPVELAGPDDRLAGIGDEELRLLLRDIYAAAGGDHPDLDEYDRVMREDRRTAVLLTPARFTSNPPGTDHEEPDHD
ncbi:MAG: pyridoxamine 5'-phosphate oxidase [Saccharothrix sp.]|nr:pyridoxamine 5'-phosphate oxidase [Saccharothrix sp.]